MLNGLDPIIIFALYKNVTVPTGKTTIPLTANDATKLPYAIIPIYLSEEITGIFIDSESKNIDIDTDAQSTSVGGDPLVNQKALGSITTVNLIAKQGSVGLTILLSLSEMILGKVTSKEYDITYMHDSVTVFGGLIHSFSYDQGTDNDLYKIKLEISKGRPKAGVTVGGGTDGNTSLANQGTSVPAGASKPDIPVGSSTPSSAIVPGLR